jgi:hypothetical protein
MAGKPRPSGTLLDPDFISASVRIPTITGCNARYCYPRLARRIFLAARGLTGVRTLPNQEFDAMTNHDLPRPDDVASDYFDYFFLRSKGDGSVVTGSTPGTLFSAPMRAHDRANQIVKAVAISTESEHVMLVFKGSPLALDLTSSGQLIWNTQNSTSQSQHWAVTADNQLVNASTPNMALRLNVQNSTYSMAAADSTDAYQLFEMLYPSDFTYIRNCWTGKFLTNIAGAGAWQALNPALDDGQQWGITSDGFLVNRLTSSVLQLSASSPSSGLVLNLGNQVALGSGDAFQRFDINAIDGAFHSKLDSSYVIAKSGDNAVIQPYSASDDTQLMELISPFQFFGLMNGSSNGQGQRSWLYRSGNSVQLSEAVPVNDPTASFTVSRYGELISPLDGFVLQSTGAQNAPQFVDGEPDPIGFASTSFIYTNQPGPPAGYGTIALRSGGLYLILVAEHRSVSAKMWDLYNWRFSGNQVWQLTGQPNSVFSAYQGLAQSFFSDPAPLPGQVVALEAVDPETALLVGNLDKTTNVIITLVSGLLDIVAGISVGSVADNIAGRVALYVLGNSDLAARIAVFMQGSITAASIIAVADGITRAGLWMKLFRLLLPDTFWGWTLTIAKLSLTIAGWALGVGVAITGAKIAVLVGSLLNIVASDREAAAAEAALLTAHAERLRRAETTAGLQLAGG